MRVVLKVLTISLLCAGIWSVAGTAPTVRAHEGEDHSQSETTESGADTAPTYEYVTPRSCSLSLLARRSLQLHDSSSDDVKLSEAQIIYAETNLVRDLGGRWLEIGERVSIPADAVANYAEKSQSLNKAKIAAWQYYANQANFSISEIKPVKEVAVANDEDKTPAEDKKDDAEEESAAKKTGSQTAFWWLLGGAVIVGGTYYYWDNGKRNKK